MYAHSFLMVPKSKAEQMSLLYFHCFLRPKRETYQKCACTCTPSQKKENWNRIIKKHLVDTVEEEVDFCVDLSIPWKRKEMTEALA